ncbi:hypothetical protein NE237_028042 [Protea cynaroides]|uniref:Uncharacterized protein n=1 Tax=Protea cynaroides TaxID=273540 RepID=A0A9Q0GPI8_9MAGN|nr:hypothetical protein NE237_028042 [Protea cynaroides]
MEEYMQMMKLLRSQMNDLEDQVVTVAVDEQKHLTAICNMEKDLDLVLNFFLFVNVQALELINQERVSSSVKLKEKRSYYIKVVEEMNAKLQEQQDWIHSNKLHMGELGLLEGKTGEVKRKIEDKSTSRTHTIADNVNFKDLKTKMGVATARLDEISAKKSELVLKNSKMQQSIEQLKCKVAEFPSLLREMGMKALEEELKALSSDKAAETEYLHSLMEKIEQLKGISHVIRCACGVEYKVEM